MKMVFKNMMTRISYADFKQLWYWKMYPHHNFTLKWNIVITHLTLVWCHKNVTAANILLLN